MKGVLLGAGYFAQFHADAWARMPQAAISAVADPDLERARAFAARWNIGRAYSTAEEALELEAPEFVDIATRPEQHLELTRLAARRGVHVITQKPMAPTVAECEEMVAECARSGVRLVVHENWRWQPWYRRARCSMDEGAIGEVFSLGFHIRTGDGRGPEPYAPQPYFRTMKRLLVYETLVHFLDTARFLCGELSGIECRAKRINPAIAGEDAALIQASAGSALLRIDANRISGAGAPEAAFGTMDLEGTQGKIRMTAEGKLFLTRYGEAEHEIGYSIPVEGYRGDSIRAMQEHIIARFHDGAPAESEGREYLNTVRAVELCYVRMAGQPEWTAGD